MTATSSPDFDKRQRDLETHVATTAAASLATLRGIERTGDHLDRSKHLLASIDDKLATIKAAAMICAACAIVAALAALLR